MSQQNRLMDLLNGDDEDEENSEDAQELEALLRSRTPTPPPVQSQPQPGIGTGTAIQPGPSQAYSQPQGNPSRGYVQQRPGSAVQATPAGHPGPKQEHNYAPQQQQQAAAQARPQQRPASLLSRFPLPLLATWCKENLPAHEVAHKLALLDQLKARYETSTSNNPREFYADISKVIGPEALQKFSLLLQERMKNGGALLQKNQASQNQSQQQKQVQQPFQQRQQQPGQQAQQQAQQQQQQQMLRRPQGGQQQPVSSSQAATNATIMQSLLYNADQPWAAQQAQAAGQQQQAQRPAAPQPGPQSQQARPTQPWVGNGLPYAASQPPRPTQQQQQPSQAGRAANFPAFHPQPAGQQGIQVQRPAGGQAMAAATSGPSSSHATLTPAMRSHILQQAQQHGAQIAQANAVKHAADSAPGGQPPAKRVKKDKEDIDEENDIFKDTGVNLEEEENALLRNLERKVDAGPAPAPTPQAAEIPFLNLQMLRTRVEDIARRHGIASVDPNLMVLLNRAAEAHFTTIIKQMYTMARQRTDADRRRPGMVMSNNLRKKLHEINLRDAAAAKEREAQKQGGTEEDPTVGSKRKREDDTQPKKGEKVQKVKETEKQQASAANAAAVAAFGKTKWNKWGASKGTAGKPVEKASKKPRTAPTKTPATPPREAARTAAETKIEAARVPDSGLAASRANAEMMTAKLPDLIAVMEKDHMYQKSTLLYKLYAQLKD